MAHHVARLMTEAEKAEGSEADRLQELCRRAILDLWKARRAIFDRVPLQSVEEVGSAVRALRNGDDWFFRRMAYDGDEPPVRAMQLAHAVDGGARAIIRVLVGDAVRQGLADERDWLWLVRSGLPDIEPVIVLLEEAIATSPPSDDKATKEKPSDQAETDAPAVGGVQSERDDLVEKLRMFAAVAGEIADHLAAPRGEERGRRGRVKK